MSEALKEQLTKRYIPLHVRMPTRGYLAAPLVLLDVRQ